MNRSDLGSTYCVKNKKGKTSSMSDSKTIVINSHSIKKITLSLNGKAYEIPAYMSVNNLHIFISERNESKDYKRAISAVIVEKLNANGGVTAIDEIYEQEDEFFSEFITSVVENDQHIERIYADTSRELSQIERFGVAYEEYIRDMTKRIADLMKPMVESYSQFVKSIDFGGAIASFQESINHIGKTYLESISGITNVTKMIASSLEPFQQLAETIGKSLSKLRFPSITEDEINEWKTNYKKWGELGWTVLPNASFNLFKEIPEDDVSAHKAAMRYCDKASMEYIFSELTEKKVKKKDLESAIFCYYNGQYKACALLLFGIIDSKLIKAQPKEKYRAVGIGATNALKQKIKDKNGEEQLFFTGLYQINLFSCLGTFFTGKDNFVKEPKVINRNYIDHGMNTRDVRKRDCVQLFLATYNLCETMDEL